MNGRGMTASEMGKRSGASRRLRETAIRRVIEAARTNGLVDDDEGNTAALEAVADYLVADYEASSR